jgi:hypothetical protein
MKYEKRTTRIHVLPEDEPIFSEKATIIEIEDEAAGGFLVMSQPGNEEPYNGKVTIEPETWPTIKDAIERMLADLRDPSAPKEKQQ